MQKISTRKFHDVPHGATNIADALLTEKRLVSMDGRSAGGRRTEARVPAPTCLSIRQHPAPCCRPNHKYPTHLRSSTTGLSLQPRIGDGAAAMLSCLS